MRDELFLASRQQRIAGFEFWETGEVAVDGPEFRDSVADAASGDSRIVDQRPLNSGIEGKALDPLKADLGI